MIEKLEKYINIVREYGEKLDLSSPSRLKQFDETVKRSQVFDSYVKHSKTLLDLGSGVGIPGIPLAIRFPQLKVTLCEIRTRRAAFLERAVSLLDLSNLSVFCGDVRDYDGSVEIVTAQAVGRLLEVYSNCKNILDDNGAMLCIKGIGVYDEISELKKKYDVEVTVEDVSHETKLVAVKGIE